MKVLLFIQDISSVNGPLLCAGLSIGYNIQHGRKSRRQTSTSIVHEIIMSIAENVL